MRRVVIHRPGGRERLLVEETATPAPAAGEVLIAVEAAGVNYADCMVRMGLYRSAREQVGWPVTPGFEIAGRVTECGDGVDDLAPGTAVVAVTRFGGYASRVAVPRHQAFIVPPGQTVLAMAGFPTVFLTAYYALFELVHPRPGQRLLVHSAAGGVGGALLQLGALAGCETVGVVGSTHKVATARALGAGHVIDASTGDRWHQADVISPGGYDVILDANGGPSLSRSYRRLRSPGKLVVYGFATMLPRGAQRPSWSRLLWTWLRTPRFDPLRMTTHNRSVLALNLSYLFGETRLLQDAMERLLKWLTEGRIRPLPTHFYPLEEVAAAHAALEAGNTVGKLVLTM